MTGGDPIRDLPEQLTVVAWIDPLVEAEGFPPLHPYIEYVWLPVLGPTSTLLYRRLGTLANEAEATQVDTFDLALCMGLGRGIERTSVLGRSVGRLVLFGAAQWRSKDLAVRRRLGAVSERLVRRSGLSVMRAHEDLTRRVS